MKFRPSNEWCGGGTWVVVFVKIGREGVRAISDIRLCATQEPRVLAQLISQFEEG